MFHDNAVETVTACQFDHKAILLDLTQKISRRRKKRRVFRFETKWTMDEEGKLIVERVSDRRMVEVDPLQKLQKKLCICKNELTRWRLMKKRRLR